MNYPQNLTGYRFGKLLVIKDSGERQSKNVKWLCKCDCGNEKAIVRSSLILGKTKSCGCLQKRVAKNFITNINKKRGYFIKDEHTTKEIKKHEARLNWYERKLWQDLRKKILKRDSVCKKCGAETNLVVHHIYSKYWFPSFATKEDFLIVLCQNCHNKFHSKIFISMPEIFEYWLRRV